VNVVDWIGLAEDRYRWRALVNSVMNLRVPWNPGNYRVAAQVVASRAVLSSTELVSYDTSITTKRLIECWQSQTCVQYCSDSVFCRYSVATRTLEPGECVLTEFPVVVGPKPHTYVMCLGCYAPADGSTLCSCCGWPVCGPECEAAPCHANAECPVFKSARIRFQSVENCMDACPQLNCVTPLRLLLIKESNPGRWESEVKIMESHNEERRNTAIWENDQINIVEYLRGACKLADRYYYFVVLLFCKECTEFRRDMRSCVKEGSRFAFGCPKNMVPCTSTWIRTCQSHITIYNSFIREPLALSECDWSRNLAASPRSYSLSVPVAKETCWTPEKVWGGGTLLPSVRQSNPYSSGASITVQLLQTYIENLQNATITTWLMLCCSRLISEMMVSKVLYLEAMHNRLFHGSPQLRIQYASHLYLTVGALK
jgi:hypothetical protein